jgi:hypothetical protein
MVREGMCDDRLMKLGRRRRPRKETRRGRIMNREAAEDRGKEDMGMYIGSAQARVFSVRFGVTRSLLASGFLLCKI